jgi:hypothetical protein
VALREHIHIGASRAEAVAQAEVPVTLTKGLSVQARQTAGVDSEAVDVRVRNPSFHHDERH